MSAGDSGRPRRTAAVAGRGDSQRRGTSGPTSAAIRLPLDPGLAPSTERAARSRKVWTRGLCMRRSAPNYEGLPKDLAEIVAAHLVVAGQLVDSDPELAYAPRRGGAAPSCSAAYRPRGGRGDRVRGWSL